MRTLGRTAGGHEPDVLGLTADDTKHTDAAAANAGARLDAALGQQRLAMRAVLLAGANPAPSEGNHTERGDYFRTGASLTRLEAGYRPRLRSSAARSSSPRAAHR